MTRTAIAAAALLAVLGAPVLASPGERAHRSDNSYAARQQGGEATAKHRRSEDHRAHRDDSHDDDEHRGRSGRDDDRDDDRRRGRRS